VAHPSLLLKVARDTKRLTTLDLLRGLKELRGATCLTGPIWFAEDRTCRRTAFVFEHTPDRSSLTHTADPPPQPEAKK
jgi:hypothetical protein